MYPGGTWSNNTYLSFVAGIYVLGTSQSNPPTGTQEICLDDIYITDYRVGAGSNPTPTPTPTQTPQTNPIAHYRFDDGSGQTAADATGSNPATLGSTSSADTNDPAWTTSSRIGSSALSFDGVNDYVTTPALLNPSASDFTTTMWVYQDTENTTNKYNTLLTQEDGTGTGRIWLARTASNDTANPSKLYTFLGGSTLAAANPMSMNAWHHVALTKSGSTLTLYMDGIQQASAARTIESATGGMKIGSHKASANCCYWDGMIDDVRFYNRALSASEIQTLANQTTPTACHQYTSTSAIPSGFASPYDVVTSPSTNLMNVVCNTTSATLTLGKNDPLQYIYNTRYLFKTGQSSWNFISYTSAETLISNAWYPKTATATISLTSTEMANPNYALSYICSWTGTQWKCGYRDSACTQSYWQIQSFKR